MGDKIIFIVFIILSIFFISQTYDQTKHQGINIEKGKLVHFYPTGYTYNEMYRTPSEWNKYLVDNPDVDEPYLKDAILNFRPDIASSIVSKDLWYRLEVADGRYYKNQMTTKKRQPYEQYRYFLYYKQEGPVSLIISKDKEIWEPLIIEFRSNKNLWRKDFIFTYLTKDYKCTLYFKCSFFEGLYDAFTFTHP